MGSALGIPKMLMDVGIIALGYLIKSTDGPFLLAGHRPSAAIDEGVLADIPEEPSYESERRLSVSAEPSQLPGPRHFLMQYSRALFSL